MIKALTANTNGIINNHQLNLTWWQIKHINYIHRIIPIIITCLVRINKCFWCNHQAHISHHRLKISINNSNNNSSNRTNRKCRHNWALPEIITLDNRHLRPCEAMKTDPRVMIATIMHWTIPMWVWLRTTLKKAFEGNFLWKPGWAHEWQHKKNEIVPMQTRYQPANP